VTTKVLYVEHDDDNLYMLKRRHERCGDFEVLAAEHSEQGCELAASEHPDVILMDLEMPVMDGTDPQERPGHADATGEKARCVIPEPTPALHVAASPQRSATPNRCHRERSEG
jgi:DNA-binding NarL/FixJ family response regulator